MLLMTKKKICLYFFIAIFVVIGYLFPHIVRSSTISFSNFNEVSNNLYVDNQLDGDKAQEIVELVSQATTRITETFGAYTVEPVIIVVGTHENAKKFRLYTAPGMVYTLPWQHYVVINGMQPNLDVIAHELLHVEVHDRLGYWTQLTNFPRWLNEGLAMQVDYRPQYAIEGSTLNQKDFSYVTGLDKSADFWAGGREQVIANYALSKKVVAELLSLNKSVSMYDTLAQVKQGEDPKQAFSLDMLEITLEK